MSEKLAEAPPEEFSWTNLPSDLLLSISSFLPQNTHLARLRSVCKTWRSSLHPSPTKHIISTLFPTDLHLFRNSDPVSFYSDKFRVIAGGIYLLKNESLAFILSIQESKPGNLLLLHPLTSSPIVKISGDCLDSLALNWTITKLALFHSVESKPCYVPIVHDHDKESILYWLGCCFVYTSFDPMSWNYLDVEIHSFVNFSGRTYVVDRLDNVHVVDCSGSKKLTFSGWIPLPPNLPAKFKFHFKRSLVVSDGDLYLLLGLNHCNHRRVKYSNRRCYVYKVVMDDIENPNCYSLERFDNLGERALFVDKGCSFTVHTRDLPISMRHLVANRVFVTAFCHCCHCGAGDDGFHEYSPRDGKPTRKRTQRGISALFTPPSSWTYNRG